MKMVRPILMFFAVLFFAALCYVSYVMGTMESESKYKLNNSLPSVMETLTAKNLPGFTTGKVYFVHLSKVGQFGTMVYVSDDYGNYKLLSPMHFKIDWE